MNNNTSQNKTSLEEITDVNVGTTEYQAYGDMGKKRREITGILSVKNNVTKYSRTAMIVKPLAVSVSSIGFAFMIMLMTDAEIGSTTFWIAIFFGLIIGGFFEFVSTAFEPAMSEKKASSTTPMKKKFMIFVKLYAVAMHLTTAFSLPDYIMEQKANSISDSNEIKALVAKSERLKSKLNGDKTDPRIAIYVSKIDRLNESLISKRNEKTKELIANSVSEHVKKRGDALSQIKRINTDITALETKIGKAEGEQAKILANNGIGSNKIEKEVTAIEKEIAEMRTIATEDKREDRGNTWLLVLVLLVLFVILELSGTIFSILHDREILEGVGEEIAMTEEVKSKLYSTKTALNERNENIRNFEVRDSIRENQNAVVMAEYEARVKRDNIKLKEIAINSKIELENMGLQLQAKIDELDIVKHSQTLRAIDSKISQIMMITNTIDVKPKRRQTGQEPRRVGFDTNSLSKKDYIKALFRSGEVKEGMKLTPKSAIVFDRRGDETIREVYSTMLDKEIVSYHPSLGYFAKTDYQTALSRIETI